MVLVLFSGQNNVFWTVKKYFQYFILLTILWHNVFDKIWRVIGRCDELILCFSFCFCFCFSLKVRYYDTDVWKIVSFSSLWAEDQDKVYPEINHGGGRFLCIKVTDKVTVDFKSLSSRVVLKNLFFLGWNWNGEKWFPLLSEHRIG